MKIRNAMIEDFEKIMPIRLSMHELHVINEPKFFRNNEESLSKEHYKEIIENNKMFIIEDNSIVVGYSIFRDIIAKNEPDIYDQKILWIEDFAINNEYKRKGYGKELFQYLENYAKQNGYNAIELNVWWFNKEAKMFYEIMGLIESRTRMKKEVIQ